jgi:hypothetical protein
MVIAAGQAFKPGRTLFLQPGETKMSNDEHAAAARKKLADDKAAREKASKERAKSVSEIKPTPTQEECDLAALGVYLPEHEDDGSGPEPGAPETKTAEAAKPKASYSTRAASAS